MPRPSYERATRAAGSGAPSALHHLSCGHTTASGPTITGKRRLWACPYGCGFVERDRNAARNRSAS